MAVSTGLLGTQHRLPAPRSHKRRVAQPHLVDQHEQDLSGLLTFLSAPAGYGSTALACACAATCKQPGAWLALEHGGNAPVRSWRAVAASLRLEFE